VSAVLEQACKDYLQTRHKVLRKQAEYWFTCGDDGVFSFPWCCDVLNVDCKRLFNNIKHITLKDFTKKNRQGKAPGV
jgi:hypothetical protein